MKFRCPNCNHGIDFTERLSPQTDDTIDELTCPSCHSRVSLAPLIEQTNSTRPGRTIGPFELLEVAGHGGFGTVYRARDTKLERIVALKLPRDGRLTTDSLQDFYREARASSAINHPNVVHVHEIGTFEDRPYIVSEFIDGINLTEWLRISPAAPRTIAAIVRTVCEAVAAAHAMQVIHRDIKPANILIDRDNQPHIADFGLARRDGCTDLTVTEDGVILGTIAYMSPEQARGDLSQVDQRSDIYAIGVCLYQMLCGRRPFEATDSRTVLFQKTTRDAPRLRSVSREVPRDLETICQHALQLDPAKRYGSAQEMADDLGRFLDGYPIHARPVTYRTRILRWLGRNRLLAGMTSLAMLLLLGVVILAATPSSPATDLLRVSMSCQAAVDGQSLPAQIDWRFWPLDDNRLPSREGEIRVADGGRSVNVLLAAGEYLVSIDAGDSGFHEVYRLVPRESDSVGGSYHCNNFRRDEDRIVLPTVAIFPEQRAIEGMALINGGPYTTGDALPNPISPRTTVQLHDFYIECTEVTHDDFCTVMQQPVIYSSASPPQTGRHPIVGVHWYQAAHFAELRGRRLLTELEFEYAATNNGTTDVPWGTGDEPVPRWDFLEVDDDTIDVTPRSGIRGLLSNCGELTSSKLAPYAQTDIRLPEAMIQELRDSVVYRGGPATLENRESERNRGIKDRPTVPSRRHSGDYLSFRCGRSRRPGEHYFSDSAE